MASKYESRKRRLTYERAAELLRYDAKSPSGLRWKRGRGGRLAGDVAGTKADGCWQVEIDYVLHRAHRVIWLLKTEAWPEGLVDHRDRNGFNNRWRNLRSCTHKENSRNRRAGSNSQTGIVGVHPVMGGKFSAEIMVDGQSIRLGRFADLETAVKARHKAERVHFGRFAPSLVPSLDDITERASR